MFMVMMYLVYIELFFIRKIVGVFSHKGFPREKHGVYCVCLLCDVMHLLSAVFTVMFIVHCYTANVKLIWLMLSCVIMI